MAFRAQRRVWRKGDGGLGAQLASEVGRDVLARGGNAFDAAVAVNFALAVVYQQAGNIGGGGFVVYRLANGDVGTLDFRERAPFAASRDMYLDEKGEVINLSLKGHLAVGVPGAVAGMAALHEKFGSEPWDVLLRPAVTLAQDGFILTEKAAREFNRFQKDFAEQNRFVPPVLKPGGKWREGERIKFPALARTLATIGAHGRAGFYEGRVPMRWSMKWPAAAASLPIKIWRPMRRCGGRRCALAIVGMRLSHAAAQFRRGGAGAAFARRGSL